MIEKSFFLELAVAKKMEAKFVEARLHIDSPDKNKEQILKLWKTLGKIASTPIYLVLDPKTEKELGRVNGSYSDKLRVLFDRDFSRSQ
ncbi:MAG: hypothetical protein CSA62_02670 [Planctomycetota bacterium]|nr:MAG: hypothetical protein CSA62_02670 [Planctomycetota bacterium]